MDLIRGKAARPTFPFGLTLKLKHGYYRLPLRYFYIHYQCGWSGKGACLNLFQKHLCGGESLFVDVL